MKEYDPDYGPAPQEWLALDEQARIQLCEEHHGGQWSPSALRHAVVHAIVENQLALGEPVVVATLARLRSDGLDRHEAVHAIGSLLSAHLDSLLEDPGRADKGNESCHEALGKLSTGERNGLSGRS